MHFPLQPSLQEVVVNDEHNGLVMTFEHLTLIPTCKRNETNIHILLKYSTPSLKIKLKNNYMSPNSKRSWPGFVKCIYLFKKQLLQKLIAL